MRGVSHSTSRARLKCCPWLSQEPNGLAAVDIERMGNTGFDPVTSTVCKIDGKKKKRRK